MNAAQQENLKTFQLRVGQLMQAYTKKRDENKTLRLELDALKKQLGETEDKLAQKQRDYDLLKTARMIEVSTDDVKASRRRLSRLIQEVEKSIALLSVQN